MTKTAQRILLKERTEEERMRRLYYLAEDLETTRTISETLHTEGIKNWNFHVLAKDGRSHRIK